MDSGGLPRPEWDLVLISIDGIIPNSSPKTISPMDHNVRSMMKKFGFIINTADMLIKKTSNSFVYVATSLPWEESNLYNHKSYNENQDVDSEFQKFASDEENMDDFGEYQEQMFALKLSSNKDRLKKEFENGQKIMPINDLEFEESYISPYLVRSYDIFEEGEFCMLQMEYCEGGDLFKLNSYYKNNKLNNNDSKDISDTSIIPEIKNNFENNNKKNSKSDKHYFSQTSSRTKNENIINQESQHGRRFSSSFVSLIQTENPEIDKYSYPNTSGGSKIPECVLWLLLHDISCALYEIHSRGYIHLDVSPSNILKSKNYFKLADFGTVLEEGVFQFGHEGAGPYVSPETLSHPDVEVSCQTDIFSFGVVLLEAASGFFAPRSGDVRYEMLREGKIKLGSFGYKANVSDELINVINSMLDHDADKRPTAFELMQHPLAVYVSKRRNFIFQ